MDLKKHLVYFMLAVFMLARVQPALPILKAVPALTRTVTANITAICIGTKTVNLSTDINLGDQDNGDNKDAEKEGEKEAAKTMKENPEMLLHHHTLAITFYTTSGANLFRLSLSGKVRNHVNEVFRPPLA